MRKGHKGLRNESRSIKCLLHSDVLVGWQKDESKGIQIILNVKHYSHHYVPMQLWMNHVCLVARVHS